MVPTPQAADYLRLKSGVSLTRRGSEYYLGLPTRGILLADSMQVQIARYFDGRRAIREIAHGLSCEIETITSLASYLFKEGLLERYFEPIKAHFMDVSEELKSLRSSDERASISHRPGVIDGGERELQLRGESTIIISGENKLARNLLVILQASGFTHTRLISRSHLSLQIGTEDVCGIAVRTADIGKKRSEFTDELIRSAQYARGDSVAKSKPDLIISTIPLEWDYVQRWMSEGSIHLHINPIIGHHIEVGPLVIPGVTPCLRCVTLIKRDAGIPTDLEFVRAGVPSATIAMIAGLITLVVSEYIATAKSTLIGSSYWFDLLRPLRAPEQRHWSFHPECGCQ